MSSCYYRFVCKTFSKLKKINLLQSTPIFKANEYLQTKPGTKLIWELQDPVQEEELDPWRAAITNEIIDEYNMAALEILKQSTSIWVWSSGRLVTQVRGRLEWCLNVSGFT